MGLRACVSEALGESSLGLRVKCLGVRMADGRSQAARST